jgi:hypothetical protein
MPSTARLGSLAALSGAGADQIALELGHDVPGARSEEVLPRHRGEGRLDLRISDAGGPP